jgi:S-adenosylmethionine hydrolase
MAIVTLLTDSGESDHYIAAIKARILSVNPGLTLIDISHHIASCDIAHGAFVLRSVFRDFPKGTVHLVGVDAMGNRSDLMVASQVEDHFFVGMDNGLFGLVTEKAPQSSVELNKISTIATTFPERDVFAAAAAKLASGVSLTSLGPPLLQLKRMTDRYVKATKRMIAGHVIRVDATGNLITNIPRDAFETLSKGKNYVIQFSGEKIRKVMTAYNHAEQGDCFVLFNSLNLLEIGIYRGNASALLGMHYDSPVSILFEE